MIAVDRVAKRLLPLSTLLRMTLVFPNEKPSRFGIALRTGTTKQLEQRLADVRQNGLGTTERMAAQTLLELVAALSEHDRLTRGHGERVRAYSALIGEQLGLDEVEISKLQWAGLIHDIGKLAIPAEILNKPGRLTDEEFDIIKTHPAEGMALVGPLGAWLGDWVLAVGEHHERWDGTGYPNRLAGTEISLGGRIVAVADVFDVITAARSYKQPRSPHEAREELARHAGSQFDPEIVRAFLNVSIGRLRRTMWPLSWVAHVPLLGASITTPAASLVAPALVAIGSSLTGGALAPDPAPMPVVTEVIEDGSGFDVVATPSTTVVARLARIDGLTPDRTTIDGTTAPTQAGDGDHDSDATTPATPAPATNPPTATPSRAVPATPGVPPTAITVPATTPTATTPTATTPTATTPTVTTPTVTTTPVTVPAITTPTVTTTPAITTPAITTPAITTPVVTNPLVDSPQVLVPALEVPTVTVPTVTVPAVTVAPTLSLAVLVRPVARLPSKR